MSDVLSLMVKSNSILLLLIQTSILSDGSSARNSGFWALLVVSLVERIAMQAEFGAQSFIIFWWLISVHQTVTDAIIMIAPLRNWSTKPNIVFYLKLTYQNLNRALPSRNCYIKAPDKCWIYVLTDEVYASRLSKVGSKWLEPYWWSWYLF